MMSIDGLLISLIAFGRTLVGIVARPYETYRRLTDRGTLVELVWVGFLLAFYFSLATIVKTAAFRPFLLTKQFVLLFGGALVGYVVAVAVIWTGGRAVGGKGSLGRVALGWGYTLVPTVVWFLATSILYIVLPPPRTTSVGGIGFSIFFLVFSTVLFGWKIMLSYLTLRFGLRLDLGKIILVVALSLPVLAVYSVFMYRMGIFRIPFL